MSTTFATRLSSAAGRDMHFCVVVQGVPFVFTDEADVDDAVVAIAGYGLGADHVRVNCIEKLEQAAKELDLVKRRMVGGSLTLDLVDDDAGTLRGLFAPRKRRTTFVTNIHATGDLILEVASTAGETAPGIIYVDGETVQFDSLAAAEFADCTRGAFGSEAQSHYGDSVQGASVFTTPPAWTGRRVKLIAYFRREDGTTSAALAKVLDTYRLEAPPRFVGGDGWQLQCSHLSDEFAAKKVGSGQQTIDGVGERRTVSGQHEYPFPGDETATLFSTTSRQTYLRARGEGTDLQRANLGYGDVVVGATSYAAVSVTPIIGVSGTITVQTTLENLVPGGGDVLRPADLRHIALIGVGGDLGVDLVSLIVSRVGDGANGPYDLLPGQERVRLGDADWRFGAGINKSEVDDEAFIDVAEDASGWSFVVDDEFDLAEVLSSFCIAANAFWYVTSDGVLSVKRLGEERVDSVLTVDDDLVVGDPPVDYDEVDIAPRIRLTCNYDTVSEAFRGSLQLLDSEIAARFPNHDERVDIESRGLVIAELQPPNALPRPATSLVAAQTLMRTLQKSSARGRLRLPVRCLVDALILDLGDVVDVDLGVPDLEGNAAITGKTGRVVRLGPRIGDGDGLVEVTVEVFEQLFAVAPACVIASRAGATLTLRTGGPEVAGSRSTTPGRLFFAGAFVRLHDVSAATYEDAEVQSVTDTTVVLTAAPAIVIAANVDYITMVDQLDVADFPTGTNVDGYGHADYAYQMPDDDDDIVAGGAGATYATRWR